MLGRPLPLDDAFQNSALGPDNPRMQELRRQRTIRTFMMFLTMLILMDGEEPRNRQLRKNREMKYLRHRKSGLLSKNNTLGEDLFKRMRLFDTKLHHASTAHSRFDNLFKLNGDVDEEAKIDRWVMEELNREEKQGGNASAKEPNEGDSEVDTDAIRLVYHYPRNATGYYRGKWKMIDVQGNDTESQSTKVASSEAEGEGLVHSAESLTKRLLEREDEIFDKLKRRRGHETESLGVFLLPSELRLGDDANAAPIPTSHTSNARDEKSLTVTEPTGRTVFQLFSRPIPAVSEISLLDGFVRLYDVNNEHFASPRKHIFLRVRGVAIHSIGRLSLVANDGPYRSALFLKDHIRDDSVPQKTHNKNVKSNDSDDDNDDDNDDDKDDGKKRRRLLDFIRDVHNNSWEGHEGGERKTLINRVRDNALELYTHYFNVDEVGGRNWNGYVDTVDDHLNGESSHELDEEKQSIQANLTMQEKKGKRSVQRNVQTDRFLRSKESVSDVDIASDKASIQKNMTMQEKGENNSENARINRILMNKTIVSDNENVQIKSSVTDDGQLKSSGSALELDKKISKENEMSLSLIPHPFVPDDETLSLKKLPPFISKNSPSENQLQHGLNCEFELNLDVKETQWSVGEWRTMGKRLVNDVRASDPSTLSDEEDNVTYEEILKLELPAPKKRDEALVMNLIGTIESPDCHFASTVNLTAIRTDWEQAQCKAINYSFYMMLACLTQIVLLLRQLLHTQAQSAAVRVSMICIGWQGILDAMLCVGHILLCMMMQPVFTAFAMVAFFKLLIFCVIEMKYMVIIMQARINADNNYSAEDLRRRVASLHLRFYFVLIVVLVMFWTLIQTHRVICLLALYSFWIPQIIQNVITESKNPLHVNYIYGMSLTRLIPPLYMYGVPSNFFMEFFPEYTSDLFVCEILFLWVGFQAGILIAQGKYGTRFMIPTRFLPPKYDYSRPIPESLLPPQHSNERQSPDDVETNTLIGGDDKGPRNRKSSSRNGSDDSHGVTTIYESHDSSEGTSLDCVICYNSINIENKRGYMLAPCDHIFHRDCLEQWMEVKMECPICRMSLPPL